MTTVMVDQGPRRPLPEEQRPHRRVVVTMAEATMADAPAVLAMVTRCSPMSLFHRFHGFTDGLAYTRAVLDPQPGSETLVAWNGADCVGLATLGRDDVGAAHLGVLVEDAWQRRGVGSRLITALLDGARARGVSTAHADILADDRFIIRALRRLGPLMVRFGPGTLSVDITLGCDRAADHG